MLDNEFDMIKIEIEKRMEKEIKEINKLYQATIDGDSVDDFHRKCDYIPNTLILYKSKGYRRFGAFASQPWKSTEHHIKDKNCFLFSLDNKKIYPPKNKNYYELDCFEKNGPSFIYNYFYPIITIKNNTINGKSLYTYEKGHKELFDGDEKALSEDGHNEGVYFKEYEVFEIIF